MSPPRKSYTQILRREPPACACSTCSAMCTLPCFGTPDEMRRLIDAGYGDRLCVELWAHAGLTSDHDVYMLTPALKGHEGGEAPRPPFSDAGCTFWIGGLCHLHDLGLKPLEGRMGHHHPQLRSKGKSQALQTWIAEEWDGDAGRALIEEWKLAYGKGNHA